ncbi:MAG: carboxypeptidase regulatory-like domain-containing protein [Bryobacteraceae bacterium]|nr:carboxypeptidase regulatory-like domain-containing protein [Bryobacteraceae bacterium]
MARFIIRLLPVLLCILAVQAHDLSLQSELAPPAAIVRALYGGGEPVPFVKVTIYSPASPGKPHQTGFTDSLGYFAFRPASPGAWRVEVDDEMGHRVETAIQIPDPFTPASPAAPPPEPSRFERALLGVGLIVGVSGFLYGLRARRA